MSDEFLKKSCRTCLTLNEEELFDWNSDAFVQPYNYAKCFQEITQLSLSEDLPQMLCYDCAYELRIAHSFINRAHEADRKLRSHIENRLNNELTNSDQEKSALFEMPTVDLDDVNRSVPALCWQVKLDDLIAEALLDPLNDPATDLTPINQSYDLESHEAELVLTPSAPTKLPYKEEQHQQETSSEKYSAEPSHLILCGEMIEGSKMDASCDSSSEMEFITGEAINGKDDMPELGISENNSQTAAASKKKRTYRRNYVCETCGAAFKTMSDFCRHGSTEHNGIPKVKQRKPRTKKPPQKCEFCDEFFPNKYELDNHRNVTHGVKPWLCHACPSAFNTKSNLARHVTIHGNREPKYSCDVCGMQCLTPTILRGHMQVHEKDRKPKYACDECDKTFFVRSGLVLHKRLHNGDTENCKICQKAFPRPVDLKVHMRIHSKERPYQCDTCPLSFQNVTKLRYHKLEHEGVQYQCDECDKVYTNITSLRTHKRRHDEPPLQCRLCEKPFHSKYNLILHIKAVHRIHTSEAAEELVIYLKEKAFRGLRRGFPIEN